ncbi:MAG: nitrilase family protein [Flavobacterium sp.]|uniref:nitrilase family protein n=1 Tax=Flavobacterium sp. TaxID=239 RepID=UPI000C60E3C5|nr:nitrilase family protein [Flavobacterium sp.]MBF02346.1 nitrilase family protein [Flavobacterium sp.]|tara:strand:+ start:151 stop:918 length:768 start_codon:yes stop_codon:yes gene_type:complete
MRIAIFQTALIWQQPENNRNLIEKYLHTCKETFDLLILPEMFTTGFTMTPSEIAESMNGITIQWLKNLAREKKIAVTGSLIIKEQEQFYNRLVFIFPNGTLEWYDKRHLFSLAGEEKVYTKGREKRIIEYKGWKICPLICYDLRFPVFSRNIESYDLLIYVANWPKPRINAWNTLLKARAIENMVYTVGVNRIGNDANQLEYTGSSQVVDYLGNEILNAQENQGVFVVEIDKENMLETRKKLNFLNDRDEFTVFL